MNVIIFISCFILFLVVEDCGDIGDHNKMTIALEKIKSLASSHPINSSTFDLGVYEYLLLYDIKNCIKYFCYINTFLY